jgi:hypothetical protein
MVFDKWLMFAATQVLGVRRNCSVAESSHAPWHRLAFDMSIGASVWARINSKRWTTTACVLHCEACLRQCDLDLYAFWVTFTNLTNAIGSSCVQHYLKLAMWYIFFGKTIVLCEQ